MDRAHVQAEQSRSRASLQSRWRACLPSKVLSVGSGVSRLRYFVADANIPEAALDSAILQNAYESTVFKVTAHTRFQV